MKSFLTAFARVSSRHYLWVIFLSLLLFAGATFFSMKLRLDSSLVNLLPESYSTVKTLKRIQKEVGSFETLQVLVQGKNFENLKAYTEKLAVVFQNDPMVKHVDYLRDKTFLRDKALLFLSEKELTDIADRLKQRIDKETMKHNPFFVDFDDEEEESSEEPAAFSLDDYRDRYRVSDEKRYYMSEKKDLMVINLYPAGQSVNVSFAKKFFAHIRELISDNPAADSHIFIEYGGNFKNKIDEYDTLIGDVKSTAAIGLSAIFLFLLLFFRQLFPALIISVVLVFSLNITFAIAFLLFGKLNIMTAFLFVILFGLGIDYGIHFMARFLEEFREGELFDALAKTVVHTGMAIKTTALTSAVAFAFFSLADFKGFSEFGIISCLGVLLACISYFFLAPAVIVAAVKLKILRRGRAIVVNLFSLAGLVAFFGRYRKAILVGSVVVTLAGVIASFNIGFLYDFTDLRANLPQSLKVKAKLGKIFTRSNSPAIVLTESKKDLEDLDNYFVEKIDSGKITSVDKFRSIYNVVPKNQKEKIQMIGHIATQLKRVKKLSLSEQERQDVDELMELTNVKPFTAEDIPHAVRRVFTNKNGEVDKFGYIFSNLQLRDSRNSMHFSDEVHKIKIGNKDYLASNASIVFADLIKMVVREGKYISLLAFLGVCLLVFFDVLSLSRLVLIISPLVGAGFWIALVMFVFRMKLNFFNIIAIPTLIGVGVDNSIHIFHRLAEECKDKVLNLTNVFKSAGVAVIMSSLTTMIGFFGLSIAHHGGLKEIGLLAIIGILTTLLCSLIVLPALFLVVYRKRIEKLL